MPTAFIRRVDHARQPDEAARWFVFLGNRLLLIEEHGATHVPTTSVLRRAGMLPDHASLIGELDGVSCFVGELPEAETPAPLIATDLRSAHGLLPDAEYAVAGFAAQIAYWLQTSRFCPRCATPTHPDPAERAMRCPRCGLAQYPRINPAMIVLVHRPGQVLLSRQPSWPVGRYSLIAGFVEPGESLEACVRREVMEEAGVEIEMPQYLGSQPWPFPHQLMLGYHARYKSGEIVVDHSELEDARWFDLDALPNLPPPLSIARRIIEWHLRHEREPEWIFPDADPFAL